jgi:lipopolysaccharide export system permease protein
MKIFDRYLARALWGGMVTVLGFLIMLISLAVLVAEIKDVGRGDYGMMDALIHVALTAPARAFELLGVSALVGGMLGIGNLAAREEITALRAAGISPRRMVFSALLAALPIMIGAAALAEYGLPQTVQSANRRKRVAEAGQAAVLTEDDLWLRSQDSILRIGSVIGDGRMEDLQVFSFNEARFLVRVLYAERAQIETDGQWQLENVRIEDLARSERRTLPALREVAAIDAERLEILLVEEEEIPPSRQWRRAQTEADARLAEKSARRFWRVVGSILAIGSLLMLSVPFAIGSGLTASRGRRLVVGVVVGALAQVLVQAVHYLGEIQGFDAITVGLAPAAIALVATLLFIARVR